MENQPRIDPHLSDQALNDDEHVSNVLRMRKLATIGLVTWPLFGLVDAFVLTFIQEGRLWFLLILRALGLIALALSAMKVFSKNRPSPRLLHYLDTGMFTLLSVLVTLACLDFKGINSPLVLGVVTLLVARGAIIHDHWRQAILPISLTALAHPLTLGVLGLISPEIARQFTSAEHLGTFVFNQLFLFGGAAVILFGGHSVWTLRRKVFEARSLGRYRLLHRIGAGGMGEVWAAHHRTLKRKVAVKILRPEKHLEEHAVERFNREVQATAELTHPNTVRVFDYGVTDDGLCYYAMELLEGSDMGALIKQEGKLPPSRVISLMLQAASALAEAHSRGIIHRDIKPENLFVSKLVGGGEVLKVLDFGLVRLQSQVEQQQALTHVGMAMGTPSYISPEVLQGQTADSRSDVYALGCVMYHLLCGEPPFTHADMYQVMLAHLRNEPPPIAPRVKGHVPPELEQLLARCLNKNPKQRFANALELSKALHRALKAVLSSSIVPARREPEEMETMMYARHRSIPSQVGV